MTKILTAAYLLFLTFSIAAQTVYLEGDAQFTALSGQEVLVLQKLDVGMYESFALRFAPDTVTIRKVTTGDGAPTKLVARYQLSGLLDKKLLDRFPKVVADISAELASFRKELESRRGESDLWVDYQLFKDVSFGDTEYFVIRFQDGDTTYGGVFYSVSTTDPRFDKMPLSGSRLDSVLACELIDAGTLVLFQGVEGFTMVERKNLSK